MIPTRAEAPQPSLRPVAAEPSVIAIPKGEMESLQFDRPGQCALRLSLLLDDACGAGTADAIVIEEAAVTVSA